MSKDIKKIAVIFVLIVILMLSAVYILAQLDEEEQQDGQTEGEEQPIELPEGLTGENVRGYNPDAIPPSLDLGSGTVTVGEDFTGDMDVTLNGGTLNIEGKVVSISPDNVELSVSTDSKYSEFHLINYNSIVKYENLGKI